MELISSCKPADFVNVAYGNSCLNLRKRINIVIQEIKSNSSGTMIFFFNVDWIGDNNYDFYNGSARTLFKNRAKEKNTKIIILLITDLVNHSTNTENTSIISHRCDSHKSRKGISQIQPGIQTVKHRLRGTDA